MKKTVVVGASNNPDRYAYKATKMLLEAGHKVELIGLKKGTQVFDLTIQPFGTPVEEVDTITLYLSAVNQQEYYDYLLNLKPRRIIFNPGTENPEFVEMAKQKGIEVENACTLVLLSLNSF